MSQVFNIHFRDGTLIRAGEVQLVELDENLTRLRVEQIEGPEAFVDPEAIFCVTIMENPFVRRNGVIGFEGGK